MSSTTLPLHLIVSVDGLDQNALAEIVAFIEARRRSTPSIPAPGAPSGGLPADAPIPAPVQTAAPAPGTASWEVDEIRLVLSSLDQGRSEWQLRAAVLRDALDGSGMVTRERIHELGHPADQSLRGFAKPVLTATKELVRVGRLAAGSRPALLEPVYQAGPGQATAYEVPSAAYDVWRISKGLCGDSVLDRWAS